MIIVAMHRCTKALTLKVVIGALTYDSGICHVARSQRSDTVDQHCPVHVCGHATDVSAYYTTFYTKYNKKYRIFA